MMFSDGQWRVLLVYSPGNGDVDTLGAADASGFRSSSRREGFGSPNIKHPRLGGPSPARLKSVANQQ